VKAILALLLSAMAALAEVVGVEWDYDGPMESVAMFEIDYRPQRPAFSAWRPSGTSVNLRYYVDLPDGTWQFRVRAVTVAGVRSGNSNVCTLRVPYVPPPPPPTHVQIIVRNAAGHVVNAMIDPLSARAFYRMAPSGPPQVERSTNLLQWEAFGQGCPPGEYTLELKLITIHQ